MKDITSIAKSKEVITGLRVNRESVYYTALFGAAFLLSVALLIISLVQENKGLTIYASVLVPLFLVASLVAARSVCVSKNKIYVRRGVLVIKSFFCTRRIEIASIERLTAANFGNKGQTSVNVTYGNKTAKYIFKNLTKEEIAHLRRATARN